jgi:hypothetical protein
MPTHHLRYPFEPTSVGLIGASDRPGPWDLDPQSAGRRIQGRSFPGKPPSPAGWGDLQSGQTTGQRGLRLHYPADSMVPRSTLSSDRSSLQIACPQQVQIHAGRLKLKNSV